MKQTDSQFVCKLCDMMEKYPSVINWDEQGLRMVVESINQMEGVVLPQYFRHSNFTSFIRQLNMYDFHKLQKDEQSSNQFIVFVHDIFKRGNQRNFHFIQRKKKNKEQQQTIVQFNKKNQHLIQKIKNSQSLSEEMKNSIAKLIEFKFIATENSKKLSVELQMVYKELKDCRSKKISNAIKQMKDKVIEEMSQQVMISKNIDKLLESSLLTEKQNQPQLGNHLNSHYYPSILSKDYSMREIIFDCNGMHAKPSFIPFPSNYAFYSQMSGNGMSSQNILFYSNSQLHSEMGYDNKEVSRAKQEQDDEQNSMSVVGEEELQELLKEVKKDNNQRVLQNNLE